MKRYLILYGLIVLTHNAFGSENDSLCSDTEWLDVTVAGLSNVEHREIDHAGPDSVLLSSHLVSSSADSEKYVLRVVSDTGFGQLHDTSAALQSRLSNTSTGACNPDVHQSSIEDLAYLDVVSDASFGVGYPAGTSLNDLFDVTVELSLKNDQIPDLIFNPRNPQTVTQYLLREPKVPLMINLRLNKMPQKVSNHSFTINVFTANGNIFSSMSDPITLDL